MAPLACGGSEKKLSAAGSRRRRHRNDGLSQQGGGDREEEWWRGAPCHSSALTDCWQPVIRPAMLARTPRRTISCPAAFSSPHPPAWLNGTFERSESVELCLITLLPTRGEVCLLGGGMCLCVWLTLGVKRDLSCAGGGGA